MSDLRIECDQMFDGDGWTGPTTIDISDGWIVSVLPAEVADSQPSGQHSLRSPTVIPGLVDFAVSASGYAESPSPTDPYLPERAYARMCLRYGVTSIVDVNNSVGPLSYLSSLSEDRQGPRLTHTAGRLATQSASRHDIVVSEDSAPSVMDAQFSLGAALVSVGWMNAETLDVVLGHAHDRGMAVLLGNQTSPETPGLVALPGIRGGGGPGESLDQTGADIRFRIPQLHACAHWTVEGILDAPNAHLAAPVLPHCRNFARSRGRIGRRIAQPIVGRYYPDRDPQLLHSGSEEATTGALIAGRCVASSAGGSTGMVPGLSLWAELARLAELGTLASALSSATSVPARLLSTASEDVAVGRIRPGCRADLLLTSGGIDSELSVLLDGLTNVVLAGASLSASDLAEEVEDMVAEALRGSL